MNNVKLVELAKKAGFEFINDDENGSLNIIDWSKNYDQELETFFSLVVRKCANLSDQVFYDSKGTRTSGGYIKIQLGVK